MNESPPLRVALGADGVSIWSREIFGSNEPSRVRDFLARAFAVSEVEAVELRRTKGFGRIRYSATGNPALVWKKLSRVLRSPGNSTSYEAPADPAPRGGLENGAAFNGAVAGALTNGALTNGALELTRATRTGAGAAPAVDAGLLYLDGRSERAVRVSRIGDVLSTWHVRHRSESSLGLRHPLLLNRRDVVFRLEEELSAIVGVKHYRVSALTASVSLRFDQHATTVERIARELEQAWPRLLEGLDGPPSQKRLVAAAGLAGLAYTGQYLVPALRPIAVAGMTLYSLPNVVNAGRQLTRGQVGISALYTTGVAFMLISGMPFTASVMAVLMQSWPHLARRKIVQSQRRLFAAQRRRPAWARLVHGDGVELEAHVDGLRPGDVIVVRSGEVVPVDGVVESGSAAVLADAPFLGDHVEDRSPGDAVAAGAVVRDGSLSIRVQRAGAETAASHVASLLPHATFAALPSSLEAERIADRNARPVLGLSLLSLALTRNLQVSQALIRPDYATAPRLSAQLSALQGIAQAFELGAVLRNPAALDRLAAARVYVIDDTAGIDQQGVEVATVDVIEGVSAQLVVAYAAAAQRRSGSEQSHALGAFASKRRPVFPNGDSVHHYAGVTRCRHGGHDIEVATESYLRALGVDVPQGFQTQIASRPEAPSNGVTAARERSLRPLWVLRDGRVIGGVSFARRGELVGRRALAALQAQSSKARLVYVSSRGHAEAQALARTLGIDSFHAGLRPADKAALIRGLGRDTLWLGDGSAPDAREALLASSVSVSVAALSARFRDDAADVLLPHRGLAVLPNLIEVSRAHERRRVKDYRVVYGANLLSVLGAFVANFTALQSGLLSNVGTGLVYARHARALDRLASAAEAKHARLEGSAVIR
jgi:cation transport ATPase